MCQRGCSWLFAVALASLIGCNQTQDWLARSFPPRPSSGEILHGNNVDPTLLATAAEPPSRGPDTAAKLDELLNRAGQYDNANQLREARREYTKVLAISPGHPYALHRMGTICDRENKYREAEQFYSAALKQNPRDSVLLADLGYSHFRQGNYQASFENLRAALLTDPDNVSAQRNLGILYAATGDREQAYRILTEVVGERDAGAIIAQYASHSSQVAQTSQMPMSSAQANVEVAAAPAANEATRELFNNPANMNDATRRLAQKMEELQRNQNRGSQVQNPPTDIRAPNPRSGPLGADRSETVASLPPQNPQSNHWALRQNVPPDDIQSVLDDIEQERTGAQPVRRIAHANENPHFEQRTAANTDGQGAIVIGPRNSNPRAPGANQPDEARPASPRNVDYQQARAIAAQLAFQTGGEQLFASNATIDTRAERSTEPVEMTAPAPREAYVRENRSAPPASQNGQNRSAPQSNLTGQEYSTSAADSEFANAALTGFDSRNTAAPERAAPLERAAPTETIRSAAVLDDDTGIRITPGKVRRRNAPGATLNFDAERPATTQSRPAPQFSGGRPPAAREPAPWSQGRPASSGQTDWSTGSGTDVELLEPSTPGRTRGPIEPPPYRG